jgi:hypothetical protein
MNPIMEVDSGSAGDSVDEFAVPRDVAAADLSTAEAQ